MDLTPETLRSATFRDKLRGYHPDDVDEFLESVARGLEVLLARLRDATERARAAQPEQPRPEADEAVRTLTLAQRTADLAVREAKIEAERLVKAAEDRARGIVGDAEENALQLAEEAQAELRTDLEKLQAARDNLLGEVRAVALWLDGERSRLRRAIIDVADKVETVREGSDVPRPKPVVVPPPPREKPRQPRAEEATPPRGQSRTPPNAAPAPRQPTPPGGQPAVSGSRPRPEPKPEPPRQTPRAESPRTESPRAKPARAEPRPEPPRREPPRAEPPRAEAQRAEAPPAPPQAPRLSEPADANVLRRAQQGIAADVEREEARQEPRRAEPDRLDDDPYFAELRRAITDDTPLGPRDDDWNPTDAGVVPPQNGSSS